MALFTVLTGGTPLPQTLGSFRPFSKQKVPSPNTILWMPSVSKLNTNKVVPNRVKGGAQVFSLSPLRHTV